MAEKRYARSPLLYVEQSGISEPKARMQHQYQSPKRASKQSKDQESAAPPKKKPKKISAKNKLDDQPEADGAVQNKEANISESDVTSHPETGEDENQDKKFKEMSIKEKAAYLTNRPARAPLLRCEVITEERSYRGVIVEGDDTAVKMRVGRRKTVTNIQIADMKDIRLLGLV